jgi:DNA polymerase III alpha subunit (gram-positive type)
VAGTENTTNPTPSPPETPVRNEKIKQNPPEMSSPVYIELHARSAFSFLRGASIPEDYIQLAAAHNSPAMALTDVDGCAVG